MTFFVNIFDAIGVALCVLAIVASILWMVGAHYIGEFRHWRTKGNAFFNGQRWDSAGGWAIKIHHEIPEDGRWSVLVRDRLGANFRWDSQLMSVNDLRKFINNYRLYVKG